MGFWLRSFDMVTSVQMKPETSTKQRAKKTKVEITPYPGQLPDGVLMPEKLEIAKKVLSKVKNLKSAFQNGK